MNPIAELFSDLHSPDPSIRFSVLSRIEDLSWTEEQKATFEQLYESEKDPGIRFHMQKVMARWNQSGKHKATAAEIELLLKDPQKNELSLALLLESVKRSEAPVIILNLREAKWPEFSTRLLPSVLKFLRRYGSFEDSSEIELLCRHHDARVLSTAIEALEKISPDRLKDLIVPLLINPNFGIRSKAVRLLHRWDPNEALRHFESMLFSETETEKQAALYHAFFFPFPSIEGLMLKFLGMEKNEDLIEKAGLLFRANPSTKTPAKLLEASQASAGKKKQLIVEILKGVLQSLFQSGMVKAKPEQMLQVLEQHFKEKKAKLILERYSLGLTSSSPQTRFNSAIKLCQLVNYGFKPAESTVRAFLEKEKNTEIKEKVKQYLTACLPSTSAEKIADNYTQLSAEKKIEFFNNLDQETFTKQNFEFRQHFKDETDELKVLILKSIEKFGSKNDATFLQKKLKSENPQIIAAAIDALAELDPDSLSPYLPQLLKHQSDEVKLTALKIFSRFDKAQALALVEKLIFSVKSSQRKHGIFCASQFDFPSVRQILIKAFNSEESQENLQQISNLLLANCDQQLLFEIFTYWKTCKTSRSEELQKLTREIAENLIINRNTSFTSRELLLAAASKNYEEEKKKQEERAAYKLENIQKIRKQQNNSPKIDKSLISFTIVAYAIGAILTAIIWFGFMAPTDPKLLRKAKSPKISKNALLNKVITVKGKVIYSDPDSLLIRIENKLGKLKGTFEIQFPASEKNLPKTGNIFNGQIKLIKKEKKRIKANLVTAF